MSFWNLLVFVFLISCKQETSENETAEQIEYSLPMADLECIPGGEYISIGDTPTTGADYAEASFEVRMGRENGCTMVGECSPPALARSALTLCARPHQAAASSPRHTRCLGTMWV